MGLARQHKAKVQQKQAKKSEDDYQPVVKAELLINKPMGALPEALQKLKDGFEGDRQTLKLLSGNEQRDPFKVELIEKYRPLCEYFMQNYEDWARLDCLFWWFIWRSDIEAFIDIEPELYKAVVCGLTAPVKGFERDWQTYYCDMVFLYCDENLKAAQEEGKKWDHSCLIKLVADITNGEIIINVPLKAKIYAAYGKVSMQQGNNQDAIKAFTTALELNEKVGVKKLLTKCIDLVEVIGLDSSESGEGNE